MGPWWCPSTWCALCSQICCNAVWQPQHRKSPVLWGAPLQIHTENFSYQKSKDACTYRYISTHIKKPLELWIQFNPVDSTFLSMWTLGWVWSCAAFLSWYFYFCTRVSSSIVLVKGVYLVLCCIKIFIHFKFLFNLQVWHELSDPVWRFCQC